MDVTFDLPGTVKKVVQPVKTWVPTNEVNMNLSINSPVFGFIIFTLFSELIFPWMS